MHRGRQHARGREAESGTQQDAARATYTRGSVYDVLHRDHNRVQQLIAELEDTSADAVQSRENLFLRLRDELDFHSRAEESVVYSHLKSVAPTHERVLESIEEHRIVALLLGELEAMPKNHERWIAKLRVLRENVRTHIAEEEQQLFPAMQRILDSDQARTMGTEVARQKEAWMQVERVSPAIAGMVRGITQVAERLPYGAGMVATAVQNNPQMVNRAATAVASITPNRRRGVFGMWYRMMLLPVRVPLALVTR
jgi:hemerythrin-like domain-containing protein